MGVATTVNDLIERAKALNPKIRELRGSIEAERMLPASLVRSMGEAGLLALWRPSALGGAELNARDNVRVIEELSRADGSVGWCAAVAGTTSRIAAYLDEAVAREIYGNGQTPVAGVFVPSGKATPAPGGYRLTGRWSYGSFIRNSEWVIGAGVIFDGGVPRPGVTGFPDFRFFHFPIRETTLIDNWRVVGLRGTGSIDYAVEDIFIPEGRAVCPFTAKPRYDRALYAAPIFSVLLPPCLAAVALGVARTAIDEFIALAEGKTPTMSKSKLRDRAHAQTTVAKAEATLRSGRAFLMETLDDLWSELEARQPLSIRARAMVRLAVTHAIAGATQAVDLIYEAAGASALFETGLIERCLRDVHATTQHISTSSANYESCGRILLGLEWGAGVL